MDKEFSVTDGKELISLARKSIEYASATGRKFSETTSKKRLLEKLGVFVTLNTFPEKDLKGCIGLPYPTMPLWNAVIEAAASAAFKDPRFPPLQANEFEKIVVEISVLTMPEEIRGEKSSVRDQIRIGKDGLIVNKGGRSGLLLPQVASEYGWTPDEFLSHCCEKAMLPPTAWRSAECAVFKFQAQIFSEKEPKGKVEEL